VSEPVRLPVSAAATAELRERFAARQAAERALAEYMAAVLDTLGVDRERYLAFDDETGEVILAPEDPAG
jgi:hypothetical protein